MNYNPYDLVPLLINGKPIDGRPFEFDSDVVNQKKMTNAFGQLVKPTKVMTMCPDCAAGFQLDVCLTDPPFVPVAVSCPICKPAPTPLADPFVNPIKSGRVQPFELEPILADPNRPLADDGRVAADSFLVPETIEQPLVPPKPKPTKKPKKPKPTVVDDQSGLSVTKVSKRVSTELADGVIGEERDFDDSGMLE